MEPETAAPRYRCRNMLFVAAAIITLFVFASSAFAVVGSDQRNALICFTQHEQLDGDGGTCALDHPEQT